MQEADRVVKNTGILYARMAITVFISLYATRLILSALGVTDFGIFNVVGGIIAMLTFLNNAMASATQRFMSYAEGAGDVKKLKTIFNVSIVLHVIIAILVFVLFEVAGYFLFNGVLKIPEARIGVAKLIFQFTIVSTLFTIISVPYDAVINAHENMLLFAVLSIVEALFKLAIALYIITTHYDHLMAYGFLMALLSILLLAIRRMYCQKNYVECQINIRAHYSKPIFLEMTSFAGWSFLGSATSMLANYGQGIVMNVFFGTIVNAAQGIASQVSGQLGVFAGTMLKALNPLIDKSEGAGNRTLMLKVSMVGSKVSFFLLMLFYIPALIEMPYIFKFWLKNVPEYAVVFCRLMLFRNLIDQLFVTLVSSISAEGNIKKYQVYTSLLSVFPLLISFFLFKLQYPVYSLYIVFIVYSLSVSAITLYFSGKNLGLSIPFFLKNVVGRCLVSFLIVMFIANLPVWLMQDGFSRILFVFSSSVVCFFMVVWFIGLSLEERNKFGEISRSIAGKLIKTIKTNKLN